MLTQSRLICFKLLSASAGASGQVEEKECEHPVEGDDHETEPE